MRNCQKPLKAENKDCFAEVNNRYCKEKSEKAKRGQIVSKDLSTTNINERSVCTLLS